MWRVSLSLSLSLKYNVFIEESKFDPRKIGQKHINLGYKSTFIIYLFIYLFIFKVLIAITLQLFSISSCPQSCSLTLVRKKKGNNFNSSS